MTEADRFKLWVTLAHLLVLAAVLLLSMAMGDWGLDAGVLPER